MVKPYKTFTLTEHLTVEVFGKPDNWSMYEESAWRKLSELAQKRKISQILSPFPQEFNARICTVDELREYKISGLEKNNIHILRTPDLQPAEGAVIPKGAGFWTTSADCPMILIYDPSGSTVAASHSGRNSLIDVDFLMGKPARENFSVVDGLIKQFPSEIRSKLNVFIVCRIDAEHFAHPFDHQEKGELNKKMVTAIIERYGAECIVGPKEQGKISLPILIQKQCEAYGILPEHITDGGLTTFTDERLWSYRRGDKRERNGILVIHR
jgi:copper oxidase (laccase) domain-containing protein